MYSLCIDINNKLFTGRPHFASCQVWSIKVICKDFTRIYRAENLNTHLHLNYCLRANLLEYLLCSRQNCHYFVPRYSHSHVSCTVPTLKHSSRWSRFRCKQWQEFQGHRPCMRGDRRYLESATVAWHRGILKSSVCQQIWPFFYSLLIWLLIEKQKSLWKTNSRLGTRRKFKVN